MVHKLVMRIENLSSSVTEEHIQELLEPFQEGVSKIIMPQAVMWMRTPLGRVEVSFNRETEAIQAYARLQGAVIDGSKITISFVRIEVSSGSRNSPERRRSRSRSRRRSRRDSSPPPRKRDRSRRRSRSRGRRSSRSSRSPSGSPAWD